MSLALQIFVTGLTAGVYGVVAIGYTLIYRLTGVVHFALGDFIALAVFATLLVAPGTAPVTQTSVGGARFVLALATGLAVCVAAGTLTYLLAIKPYLERGSTIRSHASGLRRWRARCGGDRAHLRRGSSRRRRARRPLGPFLVVTQILR